MFICHSQTKNYFKYDLEKRSKKRSIAAQKAAEEIEREESEREMMLALKFCTIDLHGPLPGFEKDEEKNNHEDHQVPFNAKIPMVFNLLFY